MPEERPAIWHDAGHCIWHLCVGASEYRLGYQDGRIVHLGFGRDLPDDAWTWADSQRPVPTVAPDWHAYGSELTYAVDGEERFDSFDLIGHDLSRGGHPTCTVRLADIRAEIEVTLEYEVFGDLGLVVRTQRVSNVGDAPIELTALPSFRLRCAPADYVLETLYGDWSDECRHQQSPLPFGTTSVESRTGTTGFAHAPWFALRSDSGCTFGALAYSGNWILEFRRIWKLGSVTITGGMNSWRFTYRLPVGESVTSPEAVIGFTMGDGNAVSRALHEYQQRHVIPAPERLPAVQFNNYAADHPDPLDLTRLKQYAAAAGRLGCEVFTLDAGWHINESAGEGSGWDAHLGDWIPNDELFPDGLGAFADYVRDRGLEFGIWMEPESLSPTARVLAEHPDWVHRRGDRPIVLSNRYVLRLGEPAVQEWLVKRICAIIGETGAAWLKWDFNTFVLEGGDGVARNELVAHIDGLYRIWDLIRGQFPDLFFEACAGGGGRFDLQSTRHSNVTWMSDVLAPIPALGVRFGWSHLHPARVCNNSLTHWPCDYHWLSEDDFEGRGRSLFPAHGDLDFRTRIPMMGAFGLSAPLELWEEPDLERVSHHIAVYKQLRPVICGGDQYRLTPDPPRDGSGDWAAMCFVTRDGSEAALFAFRLGDSAPKHAFAIPGLDPSATYRLDDDDRGELGECPGSALAEEGIECSLEHIWRSALVTLRRV
jgi:alpha-galactosidase